MSSNSGKQTFEQTNDSLVADIVAIHLPNNVK